MSLTKKDFRIIATHLHDAKPPRSDVGFSQWSKDCATVANSLKYINPLFDTKRFIDACENGLN